MTAIKGYQNIFIQILTCSAIVVVSDPLGVAAILGGRSAINLPFKSTWCPTMRQFPFLRDPE